jgi:hypothetical protein
MVLAEVVNIKAAMTERPECLDDSSRVWDCWVMLDWESLIRWRQCFKGCYAGTILLWDNVPVQTTHVRSVSLLIGVCSCGTSGLNF